MEILLRYFPHLTAEQVDKYKQLLDLYSFWNKQINVISRKDIDHLYERHVLHSLSLAKILRFAPGTKIIDVGTGGGFPGIPLAIMFPDVEFNLIDSIGKKIKVVKDIIDNLALSNSAAIVTRAEKVKSTYDFVVSRAVTSLPVFYSWTKRLISANSKHNISNGILYLKGGDITEELHSFKTYKVFDIDSFYTEDFFLTKKVVYIPYEQ